MDALILSCGTGGGHDAVGLAIYEELRRRGERADFLDPYTLQSDKLSSAVANTYIRLVQRFPYLFGVIYQLGELVRHMPGRSPVYFANRKIAKRLACYLERHSYDVILTSHLFPAEMLTFLKRQGRLTAITVFVATDYTCIPFTEETECDYYVIPGEVQREEFLKRGIPEEKIRSFGIPLARIYYEQMDQDAAKKELGLREDRDYVLLAGGSIGAGSVMQAAQTLKQYYREHDRVVLVVVCGNNEKLYRRMRSMEDERLIALERTDRMALYMKACLLFLSKAGGISSTEAAVLGLPFIQIPSIPGCETHNRRFFSESGMSIAVKNAGQDLIRAVSVIDRQEVRKGMRKAQETAIPQDALCHICDWLEEIDWC